MMIYAVFIGLGATAGLAWSAWQSPARLARPVLDGGLAALTGGLLGGRLAEVLLNWAYYRQHLLEAANLASGGLEWPGALLGALLALAGYAAWVRQPFGLLADRLLPLLACCTCAAWLGCWVSGCFYGERLAAWGLATLDERGEAASRLPLQMIGALLALLTLWLVQQVDSHSRQPGKGRRPGESAWMGLALYAVGWLALSFLRASPAPILAGLAWDAWMAIFFIILALVMLLAPALLAQLHSAALRQNAPLGDNSADLPDPKEKSL